ncbi:PRC-barrel domain-containing protein [Salinihabitans flavidus]|uniref:PRC-barrel domain-containing protein n=1 Tax=Salinihabitans flavidus TaxID=569882 RepID=A0A1H8VPU3_9RHOB|nr:PRC-barrel domain-containing protein [Salinihabitans flavidus]SEP17462.1 PRC-barrel domain-containing protein [Salinihabitans flavidus]
MRQILAYSAIAALSATPILAESHSSTEGDMQTSPSTESSESQTDMNVEDGQDADMNTQESELTSEEREQLTAEEIKGQTVFDANGSEVGEISEILLNDDGQITEVVIDVGGFLGMGAKSVAVAFADLNLMRDSTEADGRLHISTMHTEEDLDNMPEWDG